MVSNPVAISLSSLLRYCFILSSMTFCILVFSLISMTSSFSLVSFCWSSKCWDAPDLRTRPLSHLVHIFSLVLQSKIEKQLSFIFTPTKLLSLHICITILYYLVYSHTHTHTHTHTHRYCYLCFSIISLSLLEHKLHENNKFGDLLIYASEQRLTYRRC